jgi:glycolate oxidase FAD binding subunit
MGEVRRPASTAELADMVRDAAAAGRSLEVLGTGSRRDFGRPVEADAILELGAFSGVMVYEPEELVLTVGAATPMAEIEALLAANSQQLAFEPPDLGPLWGRPAGQGSMGGMLSVGLGGPRRIVAGGPRDHFLGFKGVNGFGEAFAAGGRVVKNVTGYDLPKLFAGAFGTLGALTEVTVKVLPRPEAVQTLAIAGLDEAVGLRALIEAMGGAYQVTGAAHLPAGLADDARAATLLRLESIPATVAAATEELVALLKPLGGEVRELDAPTSAALWRDIGAGVPFIAGDAPVWRLSIPPASAAATGAALRRAGCGGLYYDWGGGAVWVEGAGEDGGAAAIRTVLREVAGDGHATLLRGSPALRAAAEPFEPMAPVLAALTARVKSQFDPAGVLNPGRMYRGV